MQVLMLHHCCRNIKQKSKGVLHKLTSCHLLILAAHTWHYFSTVWNTSEKWQNRQNRKTISVCLCVSSPRLGTLPVPGSGVSGDVVSAPSSTSWIWDTDRNKVRDIFIQNVFQNVTGFNWPPLFFISSTGREKLTGVKKRIHRNKIGSHSKT